MKTFTTKYNATRALKTRAAALGIDFADIDHTVEAVGEKAFFARITAGPRVEEFADIAEIVVPAEEPAAEEEIPAEVEAPAAEAEEGDLRPRFLQQDDTAEEPVAEEEAAPKKNKYYIHEISALKGACEAVWAIADAMLRDHQTEGTEFSRAAVIEACRKAGIAFGTARTQYQRWKQDRGL